MSEASANPHPHNHLHGIQFIRDWVERRRALAPDVPDLEEAKHPTFNDRVAVLITNVVGTMWCAYAFALLAFVSLPQAIAGGTATLVSWTAQTFLQLVLLSIIMVGQRVASKASDLQAFQTYKDAEAILHISDQLQELITLNNKLTQEIHEAIRSGDRANQGAAPPAAS